MKNNRTRKLSQRVCYALIAGMAGAFLIPQVGYAGPTGEHDYTAGVSVDRNTANTTKITATATNNVINWRDYSVNQGELVQYDGGNKTNNYLNIVTGANTSNINGKIEGGNNVYIVNPNGVIFGKSAVVNVGHLHVSTQAISTVNTAADMANNVSPLGTSVGLSDVVNMGKDITANTVEVHGKNVRFLNAANVHTTASPVVLHTDTANGGYAHIGYKSGSMPTTTDYQVNGAAATAADNYYQLVSTKAELSAINTDDTSRAGNYMLENDIDFQNNAHTPLGNAAHPFKGKLDGNFFRIENINVSGVDNAGLFGVLDGASIYNVGVVGGSTASSTTSGVYAGGIAGDARNSHLYNIYVKGTKVNGEPSAHGGLVGHTANTTIDGAYSKAQVGADGVGIVGYVDPGTKITNTYNDSVYIANPNTAALFLGAVSTNNAATIENSYTTSRSISTADNLIEDEFKNVFGASATAGYMENLRSHKVLDAYASKTYTVSYDTTTLPSPPGWNINNDGAPGAKWRIYEGRTLPLLTAFMNGRVDSVGSVGVEYKYRKFNKDGTLVRDFAQASNNHADVTKNPHDATKDLTYDSKIIKIVADGSTNIGDTSNVTYDKTLTSDDKNRVKTYTDTNPAALDRDSNIRNAGTKAILWSDQDGPNLRNVNITIAKRKVSVQGSNIVATRRYDGTRDVTEAFKTAIQNGGITAGGFTPEDLNDPDPSRRIKITPSTDFKAMMANKDAEDDKEVTFSGKLTFAGDNKDNYDIGDFDFTTSTNTAKGKANITKAPLILKVTKDSTTKVYDGTDAVTEAAMSADPNIKLDETLRRTGETDAADIKSDETHKKDDVSINYASIGSPTYINSTTGAAEVHAGTHKIRYKNVELQGADKDNYELYYQMPDATQTAVTGNQIDLTGEITRRRITTNDFKVYEKGTNALVEATKTYDGNDEYAPTNVYLSTDENGATGIVRRDKTHITFAMQDNKGHFIDNDTSKTQTKNVKEATRVAFTVTGAADSHTDTYGGHLISDYYVLDADGVTKNDLNVGFAATGAGRITPKLLTANVVKNHIEKTYDGWADQTDGNRTKTVGDPLVTLSGWVAGDTARTNTSTATYASPNVAWDDTNKRAQAQNVTYNVSFDRGSDADSDNYILDSSTSATDKYTLTLTQDGAGNNYTGTIKQREVALTMGAVDKIYDGTAANKKSKVTSVAGTMGGSNDTVILSDDGITKAKLEQKHEQMMTAGTAESSYGRVTGSSFAEDANASNGNQHDVRYQNIDELFQAVVDAAKKNNYKVDDTVYGKGTINRRLIEKSGFQVRKNDGTIADATKVYDGTSTFALKNGETLVAKTAASGSDTGVVDKDKDNIYFTMTGENGHFTSDAAGANRTSHKSEANHVAYNVIARTKNGTTSPLSNYFFGTSDTSKRNLENVNAANPDAVTAKGSITPAKIQAQTKEITKVYDGMAEHTDGNRNVQHGDKIVGLNLIAGASGQPTNTSTAAYADKNVAYSGTNVTTKNVTYTAQLTGKYADDYEIVDAGNNVISSVNGTGDSKTVTATRNNVANMGTITPRTLNITMASVSKVYDTGSANTATNNTAVNPSGTVKSITDEPSSAVIGDILRGDGITKDDLGAAWRALRDHGDAVSDYGHKGNTPFEDENASAAPEGHDVRYTNMDTAFKNQYGLTTAGNYTVASNAYGKGTITPKALDPNKFSVEDANGHAVPASKTYDGTSDFTVDKDWKIRPSTGSGTGLFDRDANRVKFALSKNGAYFIDKNGNKTAHASNKGTAAETDMDAVKASYHVTASADPGYEKLLKNYTLNGKTLDSGEASVTGEGHIERRTINIGLSERSGINKVYDGNPNLVNGTVNNKELHHNVFSEADANANVGYVTGADNKNKLVRKANGAEVDDGAVVTVEGSYADKNVARDASDGVIDKTITYNVSIGGDVGKNYTLAYKDGATTHTANAEVGLQNVVTAKGKIEPKDISGAFKKVTKVYDRTNNVPAGAVGFDVGTAGGVISGDVVTLKAGYGALFESPNVKGSGTSRVIRGETRHNWVNYTNVELDGTDAGNYKITSDANGRLYGLGEITPLKIDSNTVINYGTVTQATKTYDGTQTVKRLVSGEESADKGDVKGYIEKAEVQVGTERVNLYGRMSVTSATYDDTKDVNNGTAQGVTYKLTYTPADDGNIVLEPNAVLKAHGTGIITKRDVTVTVKNPLTKQYDAGTAVKDASGNVITGAALNNLVELDGLTKDDDAAVTKKDNATYTTTAAYTDKNAGTGKQVDYTVNLDAASAGNYNLKYNGGSGNAFSTNDNTIEKRKVKVNFKDVSKTYDTTTANPDITGFISDADAQVLNTDHAGIAQTDPANGNKKKLQNLGGLTSNYGAGNTDATFNANADAGNKDVQYAGLGAQMGTTLGGAASNYEFDVNGYGKGKIDKATINTGDIDFGTPAQATKTYDGTMKVKKTVGGVESADKGAVKGYIPQFMWNGHDISDSVDVDTAEYDNKDVNGGAVQNVKYTFKLSDNNKNFKLGTGAKLEKRGTGIITKRDVNVTVKNPLTKQYDAGTAVKDASGNVITGAALNNLVELDGLTKDDDAAVTKKDNATYTTTAAYTDKNAGTGKQVDYTVNLDAASAGNYNLKYNGGSGNAFSTNDNTIAKRRVKVNFAPVSKDYDGSAVNDRPVVANVSAEDAAVLNTDRAGIVDGTGHLTNLDGVNRPDSQYGIRAGGVFIPDANAGKNKDVRYEGLGAQMNLTLGVDAVNYEFDVDGYGMGTIRKVPEFYIPDADYYNTLAANKMLPDEYAYENASLDRRSHFGRDAEAEIAYEPPSINIVQDGIDLSKSNIVVTDSAVFEIVNEVFG